MKRLRLAGFLLLLAGSSQAAEVREFSDAAERARYESLLRELRCLVCQNQSLADSDADLAKDLRDEVYRMIRAGQSSAEAIRFLTDRYGDFVLYRPPFKPATVLLWGGPPLFLAIGLGVWWRQRARQRAPAAPLSAAEQARLQHLLPPTDRDPA